MIFACFGIQFNADKTIYTIKRPIIPIKWSALPAGHWLWFGFRFRAGRLSTGKLLILGRVVSGPSLCFTLVQITHTMHLNCDRMKAGTGPRAVCLDDSIKPNQIINL